MTDREGGALYRYALTIGGETVAELRANLISIAAMLQGVEAMPPPVDRPGGLQAHVAETVAAAAGAVPLCPRGHGAMTYRKGGTITAGNRAGHTYPPFYSCPTCKASAEI